MVDGEEEKKNQLNESSEEQISKISKDDLEKKNISSYDFPGNPATARPVWSFILDYEPTKEEKEYNAWPRKFINVDMITGEILYQDLFS